MPCGVEEGHGGKAEFLKRNRKGDGDEHRGVGLRRLLAGGSEPARGLTECNRWVCFPNGFADFERVV